MKVRPEDLSSGLGIDTRAISLGIFHADSVMKNPGGRARYNYIRLNPTRRVDCFQPFVTRARGLELEKDSIVFALVQLIEFRSVENQAADPRSLTKDYKELSLEIFLSLYSTLRVN